MNRNDLISQIEETRMAIEVMLICQTSGHSHSRQLAREQLFELQARHRRLVAELRGTCLPWETVEQIAAYVRGDGTDAQRVALADGILEGRRVD